MASAPRAAWWIAIAMTGACMAPMRSPLPVLPGDVAARDVSVLRGVFVAGRQPDGNTVLLRAWRLDRRRQRPVGWRDALARIGREPFDVLVPGHGRPLDCAAFATYRRTFDHLLDCAAGDADKATCVDGWMDDAQALIPAEDAALARALLDYYLDLLRAPPPQRTRWCRAH